VFKCGSSSCHFKSLAGSGLSATPPPSKASSIDLSHGASNNTPPDCSPHHAILCPASRCRQPLHLELPPRLTPRPLPWRCFSPPFRVCSVSVARHHPPSSTSTRGHPLLHAARHRLPVSRRCARMPPPPPSRRLYIASPPRCLLAFALALALSPPLKTSPAVPHNSTAEQPRQPLDQSSISIATATSARVPVRCVSLHAA
jgi:hypothetical protein